MERLQCLMFSVLLGAGNLCLRLLVGIALFDD